MTRRIEPSKSLGYLSAIVLPLSSLFLSLHYFRRPEAKNIFWLFCIFLGMIHIIFPDEGSGADGVRYAARLIEMHQQEITWENFTASLYKEGGSVDIFQPLLTYIVALVTDNPHVLFTIFAVIFGFFYSRNMWYVLDKFSGSKVTVTLFCFSAIYFLVCPIWNINGVRMWTALHIFVYGALPYLYEKDKSKLAWSVLALFVHFSYFLPLLLLFSFRFLPKSLTLWVVVYVFSFLVRELDIGIVRTAISYLPNIFSSKLETYTGEAYMEVRAEEGQRYAFHVRFAAFLMNWVLTGTLILISTLGRSVLYKCKKLLPLLTFVLFFSSVANILTFIPSGGRFITVARMFLLPVIIFFIIELQRTGSYRVLRQLCLTAALLLIFPIIFLIRVGCDYYGISILLNPVLALFIEDTRPIIYTIKSFFG